MVEGLYADLKKEGRQNTEMFLRCTRLKGESLMTPFWNTMTKNHASPRWFKKWREASKTRTTTTITNVAFRIRSHFSLDP